MNIPFQKTLLLFTIWLVLPVVAFAGGKPKKPPYKEPYDVIAAVNPSAHTVTVKHVNSKDADPKTYKVDSLTEVQVDGAPGTFKDVKKGMKVDLTMGLDDSRAERLVLSSP